MSAEPTRSLTRCWSIAPTLLNFFGAALRELRNDEKMKKLIIFIWIFSAQLCDGQSFILSSEDDSQIIYDFVFESYLKERLSTKVDNLIFVEYNYLTTRNLPIKIGEIKIKKVEINKKLFKSKKHITIFRIVPLRFIQGKFVVTIVEFDAYYEKKRNSINLINRNGKTFEFVHDCAKNELISTF